MHDSIGWKPFMSIWAKASRVSEDISWMPLIAHMHDTMTVMAHLWNRWLSDSVKSNIEQDLFSKGTDNSVSSSELVRFLAAAHDIGKAIPEFQYRDLPDNDKLQMMIRHRLHESDLVPTGTISEPGAVSHSLASMMIAERNGLDRSLSIILGGHHGRPPSKPRNGASLEHVVDSYRNNTGFADENWVDVQDRLFLEACRMSDVDASYLCNIRIGSAAQIILTGLLIMADWIASDEHIFPYSEQMDLSDHALHTRSETCLKRVHLTDKWEPRVDGEFDFLGKYSFAPRPFQQAVMDVAENVDSPGLMIVEAPMGEGKTEAALVAAEIVAGRFGKSGIFFALPTRATANVIFHRMMPWFVKTFQTNPQSVTLAYGGAGLNKEFASIPKKSWNVYGDPGADSGAVVDEWMTGGKKRLLSDFAIGTVDQILMMALKQKHLALRHLALSNKVVIVDECHAYDEYMESYLLDALCWLGEYGVPTILLSATLQPSRKKLLADAYVSGKVKKRRTGSIPEWAENTDYPLITYTEGMDVSSVSPRSSGRSCEVEVCYTEYDRIGDILEDVLENGGVAGVLLNTVGRAQKAAKELMRRFGEDSISLLHSRYISVDRVEREMKALERAAPSESIRTSHIIVGTQVMEQSLDLDFDVMITDICPVDLLLQRIGRLHRHEITPRPTNLRDAICYVVDEKDRFEPGTEFVYGEYQLLNTRALIPDGKKLSLPDDIPVLVHAAYNPEGVLEPACDSARYLDAKHRYDVGAQESRNKARNYQINTPGKTRGLLGWLDSGADYLDSEATVRDSADRVDVILIQRTGDGELHILSWVDGCGGKTISPEHVPDIGTALELIGCKVSLPPTFSKDWSIRETISLLHGNMDSEIPKSWLDSGWLRDELFMILDEDMRCSWLKRDVKYSKDFGLEVITDEL